MSAVRDADSSPVPLLTASVGARYPVLVGYPACPPAFLMIGLPGEVVRRGPLCYDPEPMDDDGPRYLTPVCARHTAVVPLALTAAAAVRFA